ncbi:MAG: YdeI/OmpD-associated family protein [Bdellovibrionota bacterium]
MVQTRISSGTVHKIPPDLREALISDPNALTQWEDITVLARNEWICWIESVKKPETRRKHIERACSDLKKGKRRPCCWPGCPHRPKGERAR